MDLIKHILREELIKEINDIYNGSSSIPQSLLNKKWGSFSLREMLEYDTARERINYCNNTLKRLGSGQRRIVYQLNDKYVLKVTRGSHRFQSKNEYDTAALMSDRLDIFPRVLYTSPDFTWSINEYAKPIDDAACQRILGIPLLQKDTNTPSLEGFQLWAETKARQNSRDANSFKQNMVKRNGCEAIYENLIKTNKWFKLLYRLELSQRGDTTYGTDLNPFGYEFQYDNLGVVNRNGKEMIVILDSGFIKPFDTRKLKSKHNIDSYQINDSFY